MVNHYASLLLNLAGENKNPQNKSYFTAHDYIPLELPPALEDFHSLLFPKNSSFYYKQFLCYCFLRVMQSTNLQEAVLKYDNRITYDLDALNEYFRLKRISTPTSSNPAFRLYLLGEYLNLGVNNYYYNSYTITQNENFPEVFVYSDIDKLFLNRDKTSLTKSEDMRIHLRTPATPHIPQGGRVVHRNTLGEAVGTTGLSFVITGNFDTGPSQDIARFTSTSNKYWNFIVESPFMFEFIPFFSSLSVRETLIARMIDYGASSEGTYLNLWQHHFNEAYKFSGLLNLFMEKVNDLWLKNQM
jgi:hypothetical protein